MSELSSQLIRVLSRATGVCIGLGVILILWEGLGLRSARPEFSNLTSKALLIGVCLLPFIRLFVETKYYWNKKDRPRAVTSVLILIGLTIILFRSFSG